MVKLIKKVFQYFKRRRQNPPVYRQQLDAFSNSLNTSSRCIPIETNIDDQPVPSTVTQSVSTEEKLLQTPIGEVITLSRKKGIRCGCNHFVYSIESNGTDPGLGGQCPYCTLEAAELLNQGAISLEQAEAMSLYCSLCGRQCECGISVCSRHIHQFVNLDTSVTYLCDECIKQAERDKFFKKTLTVMLSPFVDYKRLPSSEEGKGPYDY